jgi:hypothetical protein
MPVTWNIIGSGPAPWADRSSFSSSSSSSFSTGLATTHTAGFTQLDSYSEANSSGVSTSGRGSNIAFDYGSTFTREFSYTADNAFFSSVGTTSNTESGITQSSTISDSGSYTAIRFISGSYAAFQGNGASTFTFLVSNSGITEVYVSNSIIDNTSYYYESTYFTTIRQATTSIDYGGTSSSSNSSEFTSSGQGTSSTSFSLSTTSVVTSVSIGSSSTFFRYTTTRTSATNIIISATTNISGNPATTTINTSSSYTRLTSSNLSSTGTIYTSLTISYYPVTAHLIPVVSALRTEYLRLQTATSSSIVEMSVLFGSPFTQTTLSSALYSGVEFSPFSESSLTRTVSSYSYDYSTITITNSVNTFAIITTWDFEGYIPMKSSASNEYYLGGLASSTQTHRIGSTAISTLSRLGGRSVIETRLITYTSFSTFSMVGLSSNGGTYNFQVQIPYNSYSWTTLIDFIGIAGETVTTYRNPESPFFSSAGAFMDVSRMDRIGGYQIPDNVLDMGAYITANSSFYIGYENIAELSPINLKTPIVSLNAIGNYSYSIISTANIDGDNYSFRQDKNGIWSITKNTDSFTASISLGGVGNKFEVATPIYSPPDVDNLTIGGGPYAFSVDQFASFSGYGLRYTVGNLGGSTSQKTILDKALSQLSLSKNIVAAETFKAGMANPNKASFNTNIVHTFSYTSI